MNKASMTVPLEASTDSPSTQSTSTNYRLANYEPPNFEHYADSLPGLKQQLIGMLRCNRRSAHSTVLYEKNVLSSGHPEAWY